MKSEEKVKILNTFFWIFLVIGLVLLIWRIVGNSPTDYQVYGALFVALLIKVWTVGEDFSGLKGKLSSDIPEIKNKITKLEKAVSENRNSLQKLK